MKRERERKREREEGERKGKRKVGEKIERDRDREREREREREGEWERERGTEVKKYYTTCVGLWSPVDRRCPCTPLVRVRTNIDVLHSNPERVAPPPGWRLQ